jgi:hypothetical protein
VRSTAEFFSFQTPGARPTPCIAAARFGVRESENFGNVVQYIALRYIFRNPKEHREHLFKYNQLWEVCMQIKFADGTSIEVAESMLDDFVRHDLKWVEFVHGPTSDNLLPPRKSPSRFVQSISKRVKRCSSRPVQGC